MSSAGEGLIRLGRIVRAERSRRFGTVQNAIREARVNAATWKRVEDGLPVRLDRLGAVEASLGWPPGRAQQIIDGLTPAEVPRTFREYVAAAVLPESFKADVLRLLDAYEGETEARGA